jgi:hypothetical protein
MSNVPFPSGQTQVTWGITGQNGFKDFDSGLAALKWVAEAEAKSQAAALQSSAAKPQ